MLTLDRRINGYFSYIRRTHWHPRTMMGAWEPDPHDKESEAYRHMIRFCRLGAANEGDSYNIAAHAQRCPDIASDPLWGLFAPFWVRDEAQHAEAYFRILLAFGEVKKDSFPAMLLASDQENAEHRMAYYGSCPAFRNRIAFWSAIAVDEWNTAQEYAAAAKTTFRVGGMTPAQMQARLSADEVQHHEYAVGALITIGMDAPWLRPEIMETCAEVAEWAVGNGQPAGNTEQFMFDQEPVPGSPFVPDFHRAAEETLRKCLRAWEQ